MQLARDLIPLQSKKGGVFIYFLKETPERRNLINKKGISIPGNFGWVAIDTKGGD